VISSQAGGDDQAGHGYGSRPTPPAAAPAGARGYSAPRHGRN
jgi:hypothetical protein